MALTAFLFVSVILSIMMFVIWSKKNVFNFLIKMLFLVMVIWGGVELTIQLGYVVKS